MTTDEKKISSLLGIRDEDEELLASRVKTKLVDLLLYGITGTAKSPMLSSALEVPEINNPVYVDIESGSHAAYKKGITPVEFMTYHSMRQRKIPSQTEEKSLFDLFTDLKAIHKTTSAEGNPAFNAILFDGWTEAYNIIHAQCTLDGSGDKEVGTQNDRMRAFVRVKKLSRLIRSIPVHIISTAREYTFTSSPQGTGGTISILERGPHLAGAPMRYVAAQSDIVARIRYVAGSILFSVKEDSVTLARDRFYVLPDQIKMTEPSLVEIWKYIRGEKQREAKK